MKSFTQYITELFDRTGDFHLSQSGTDFVYTFEMLHDHRSDKISFAPVGKELDKLVDDKAEEAEKTRRLPPVIRGYVYEVTFTNIQYDKKYAELELMTAGTDIDIRNKVYELSFSQHKAMVGKRGASPLALPIMPTPANMFGYELQVQTMI